MMHGRILLHFQARYSRLQTLEAQKVEFDSCTRDLGKKNLVRNLEDRAWGPPSPPRSSSPLSRCFRFTDCHKRISIITLVLEDLNRIPSKKFLSIWSGEAKLSPIDGVFALDHPRLRSL